MELSYKKTKKYKGTLIIRNATYADTGYYYCVSNETPECNIKMEGAHGKYVYVKGECQDMLMSLLSCNIFEFLTRSLEYTTLSRTDFFYRCVLMAVSGRSENF